MFKKIKRWFAKDPDTITIPISELREGETIWDYYERSIQPKVRKEQGDGKAVFFGEGTQEEWEEQKKEDDGTKPWYDRIKKL